MKNEYEHVPFLSGETVDLVVPSLAAIENDNWANWFNDQEVCRFLDHGLYPNFPENQVSFLDSLKRRERFATMILPKGSKNVIGIISLSQISHQKRSAQIAIVIGNKSKNLSQNLCALEAMALVTQHGFQQFGLDRIWAGQTYPGLRKWNKYLEILGFRTEGIQRGGFVKGREVSDLVLIACCWPVYKKLLEERGGYLWPGLTHAKDLIKQLPQRGFAELLDDTIKELEAKYFNS